MDIHERLRYLRERLNLTTRAFGAAINMSGGSITNMEKGTRNITERTIRDICREYNVNLDWLINGTEPMFKDVTSNLDIDDDVKQLAQQYSLLNDNDRALVKNIINSLLEKISALEEYKKAFNISDSLKSKSQKNAYVKNLTEQSVLPSKTEDNINKSKKLNSTEKLSLSQEERTAINAFQASLPPTAEEFEKLYPAVESYDKNKILG